MFMNSVHEQCPNSDPKTVHCIKTGLGALCAHPEPRSRAHYAHSAHVVGVAARTASRSRACRAHNQRRSHACWACTCRDTPRQPAPRSRPHFDVTTSRQPKPCRDSNRCRDLKAARTMSRHQIDVVTPRQPESCRDIKSMSRHHSEHSRLRPQNGVATSSLLSPIHPGRDIHFLSRPHADQTRSQPQVMSRPQFVFPRSPHEFHVAT